MIIQENINSSGDKIVKKIVFSAGAAIKKIFPFPGIIIIVVALIFAAAYFSGKKNHSATALPEPSAVLPPAVQETPSQDQIAATSSNFQPNAGDAVEPMAEIETLQQVIPEDKIQTQKPTLPPASVLPSVAKPAAVNSAGVAARDEKRQTDMRNLAGAQTMWYGDHKRYYTCSIYGGDCGGKKNNLPVSIGAGGKGAVDPLNQGTVCGRDYIYCGLDNTKDASKFCYFAKLETGGYYAVSANGAAKQTTMPASFESCAVAISSQKQAAATPATAQQRDAQRKADMAKLFSAQTDWRNINGQYYTCGIDSGNCQGKIANYPAGIGFALVKTPVDPTNAGSVCGRDYIYCGLDNTKDASKFCYFAKLETGGYYTASFAGNFLRSTAPAIFGECGQPN